VFEAFSIRSVCSLSSLRTSAIYVEYKYGLMFEGDESQRGSWATALDSLEAKEGSMESRNDFEGLGT
jgi:hypothetical protein